MRTITAHTPEGTEWTVRVVWLPRWRVLARRFGGWRTRRRRDKDSYGGAEAADMGVQVTGDAASAAGGEEAIIIIAVVGLAVVFGAVFWWLLLPLLLLVVDAIVVAFLVIVAALTRVLLRRPWRVEAAALSGNGLENTFGTDVVGWRAALRARDDIVNKLRTGFPAPVIGTLSQREPTG